MQPVYLKTFLCVIAGALIAYLNVIGKTGILLIASLHLALHFWGFLYFIGKISFLEKFYTETKITWISKTRNKVTQNFESCLPILGFTVGFCVVTQYTITNDFIAAFSLGTMLLLLIFEKLTETVLPKKGQ